MSWLFGWGGQAKPEYEPPKPQEIQDRLHFMRYIANDGQLTIVFFNDPQQEDALLLLPRYDQLCQQYAACFFKVDTTTVEGADLAYGAGIKDLAVPTFLFFKAGVLLKRLEGNKPNSLERLLSELA